MRLFLVFVMSAMVALGVLTACNSVHRDYSRLPVGQTNATPYPDGARRVTTTELKNLLDNSEAVVIDVRNESSYNAGHIRGAKLIPEAEVVNHIAELPKDKLIVTYCS
jgi:predicted sulfurtransferase